jgi:hypothetical protein
MRAWIVALSLVLSIGTAAASEDDDDSSKYPMAASEYKKRVDKKLVKKRDQLERRMKERAVSGSKRDTARKAFTALEDEIHKLVTEYSADNSITKNEAQAIKARSKKGRHTIYKNLGLKFDKGD